MELSFEDDDDDVVPTKNAAKTREERKRKFEEQVKKSEDSSRDVDIEMVKFLKHVTSTPAPATSDFNELVKSVTTTNRHMEQLIDATNQNSVAIAQVSRSIVMLSNSIGRNEQSKNENSFN